MKKILYMAFCLVMIFAFTGCSKSESNVSKELTGEELAQIITECGNEMTEYNPALSFDSDSDEMSMFKQFYGWETEKIAQGAVSFSLMNTQAYTIAIVKPADGCEDDVKGYYEAYTDLMLQNFDRYLEDQYEIAKQTVTEEINGYLVYVMAEDAQTIADKIAEKL